MRPSFHNGPSGIDHGFLDRCPKDRDPCPGGPAPPPPLAGTSSSTTSMHLPIERRLRSIRQGRGLGTEFADHSLFFKNNPPRHGDLTGRLAVTYANIEVLEIDGLEATTASMFFDVHGRPHPRQRGAGYATPSTSAGDARSVPVFAHTSRGSS